jgi:hypothetical protein
MPPTSDTDATIASLASSGFAMLGPHALAPHIVAACRASPSFADAHSSTSLAARFRQSSAGRHHRTAFDAPSLRAFEALEASWLPLVHAFFAADGVDNDAVLTAGSVAVSRDGGPLPFYRSELQLLQAQPLARAQFFHQDNARRGLTIVVPLIDIIHELGPTELLSGSHRLTRAATTAAADAGSIDGASSASPPPARTATSTVRAAWRDFRSSVSATSYAARFLLACAVSSRSPLSASSTALPYSCAPAVSYQRSPSLAPVQPCPKLGSALVFDSRCLHRGLANLSATTARPVLIFRYDSVGDVPPNHSVMSTIAVRSIGSIVAYFHRSA